MEVFIKHVYAKAAVISYRHDFILELTNIKSVLCMMVYKKPKMYFPTVFFLFRFVKFIIKAKFDG